MSKFPLNRRTIASLLAGTLAAISAFMTLSLLRERSCLGVGGTWDAVSRKCAVPAGVDPGAGAVSFTSAVIAIVVGIFVAFVLMRIFAAAGGGGPRRRSR